MIVEDKVSEKICQYCGGKGYVAFLYFVRPCHKCNGTGYDSSISTITREEEP